MDVIQSIDVSILHFIQDNLTCSFLDKIMVVITSVGNAGFIWIMSGIALLCTKKYRKYGVMVLLALAFCGLVGNLTLKPIIARTRPFTAYPLIKDLLIAAPTDFSFPSGHTMSSFAAATVILYMNRKLGIIAVSLSALIAFSRMYLYVHYPSDIFAGMIIGICMGLLSVMICKKIIVRKELQK